MNDEARVRINYAALGSCAVLGLCVLVLALRIAQQPVLKSDPHLLGAIAINASLCHIDPVMITFDTAGAHKVYHGAEEITPEIVAWVSALPDSHVATVIIPCGDSGGGPTDDQPAPHAQKLPTGCTSDWVDANAYLWSKTHCFNIALMRVAEENAEPAPPHTGLPKRYTGLDAQGHIPKDLQGLCAGHIEEVTQWPSGHFTIGCRQAKLAPAP